MDVTGFCIAVVQARSIVTSLKDRFTKFKEGPHQYATVLAKLDLLLKHLAVVEGLLLLYPISLPPEIADLFKETLDSINGDNFTVPPWVEKAFIGSSSAMGKLTSKAQRLARAKTFDYQLSGLQNKIEKTGNQLQHLVSVLANSLQADELRAAVLSKMDENYAAFVSKLADLRITETVKEMCAYVASKIDEAVDNSRVTETAKEMYAPVESTPAPSDTMILDFDSKDENGNPATPEGLLKHSVSYGESVTAVTGTIQGAYGALGMAGVGKTIALRGLGHDEDVKKRFHDGVHYMTFGRDATLQTVIGEIASIMKLTGASTQIQNVKGAASLREAVNYAVMWFQGKVCLYLLDDLWPSEKLPHGYFDDLRQLLRGSPHSRMAISTRSLVIASEGSIVDFGPRDPQGKVSLDMFMSHATKHSTSQSSSKVIPDSVSKILAICAGLPIALSVAGCAVSKFTRIFKTFAKACDVYAVKLENKRTLLGEKCTAYGTSLKAAILLSLEYLDGEFSEWVSENSIHMDYNIFDLYASLCVLSNQSLIPVSVLSRLWKLEEDDAFEVACLFSGMSLATIKESPSEEVGVVLHDLQLDFCRQLAMEAKEHSLWHTRLLDGYLETTNQLSPEERSIELVDFAPRPWWSEAVPEDGYVHANLSRHLVQAGYGKELAALLLEGQWTQLRRRIGGIFALETDFQVLENTPTTGDTKQSFDQIFTAVRLSWGRMMKSPRVFQFYVCGRLAKLRKSSAVVEAYMKSIEKCTPKPYLLPLSSFFQDIGSSPIMEIPVRGECSCVACSPCGQYAACAAGSDILITQTSNGEIMKLMQDLKSRVTCIAFAGGSKEVVFGSENGKVMVWEWDLSENSVRVFDGHGTHVTGVAVADGGRRIFSSSWDNTVRIWDATTTAQIGELPQSIEVHCVAVCGKYKMIAFGLDDGTLKVVDSVTRDVLFKDKHDAVCVSFSPNGSYLAAGSCRGIIRLWNTRTKARESVSLNGHEDVVTGVSFSPDGKQIASGSYDGTVRLWDVKSGQCVGICPKMASAVTSLSFTVGGQMIVSGSKDGIVRIWDARLSTASKENMSGHSRLADLLGVTISQNGLRLASAAVDGTVRIWDTHTGEQVGEAMEGHTSIVFCVSLSPDGRQLVYGSDDNTLRLWDTETHTHIGDPFYDHTALVCSVSFSFDGLRIVSGSADSTVRIWDAETQEQIGGVLHERSEELIRYVSENFDGCYIVSRHCNGGANIWNLDNRSIVWKSEPSASGFENKITDDIAESIIRSCGQWTPHLWPNSLPTYIAELSCEGHSIYSNLQGDKTLLADRLDLKVAGLWWSFHAGKNVFAAALECGAVANKACSWQVGILKFLSVCRPDGRAPQSATTGRVQRTAPISDDTVNHRFHSALEARSPDGNALNEDAMERILRFGSLRPRNKFWQAHLDLVRALDFLRGDCVLSAVARRTLAALGNSADVSSKYALMIDLQNDEGHYSFQELADCIGPALGELTVPWNLAYTGSRNFNSQLLH